MAEALGTKVQVGFGSTSTVDKFLEVLSENIALRRPIRYNGGMVGSRGVPGERTREGQRMVAGQISCTPSPVELDFILPYLLGTAEATDVFALGEALSDFYIAVDRDIKVPVYNGCKINTGTFSADDGGGFLRLDMDIMGKDETVGAAASFPALSVDVASQPYVLEDGVVSIGGTTVAVGSISISVNNMLEPKFYNSLTPTNINEMGREVTWDIMVPYGAHSALYGGAVAGQRAIATFTNGARSIIFDSILVQFEKVSPTSSGSRSAMMIPFRGVARKSSTTKELVVTSDSTG